MSIVADGYLTLLKAAQDEYIVQKSRFLCDAAPCGTEEEALAFLQDKRTRYRDATHHCYAYVIGANAGVMRFSDDGEPSGTAGMPMMDVVRHRQVVNCCVVVTRYFGGVLLGTGGLVRAYGGAAKLALSAASVIDRIPAQELIIRTDYTDVGRILYLLGQENIAQTASDYGADVTLTALPADTDRTRLAKLLTEATAGRVRLEEGERRYLDRAVSVR